MYWDKLTAEQLGALYAQFNTTEEIIKNDVQSLIQWMESQPHLPNVKDEYFLTNFLLQCKNSLETAKSQIEAYYTARATMKHLFTDRTPSQTWIRSITNIVSTMLLPKLTPEGYRILCLRIFKHSSSEVPPGEIMLKWNFMMFDLMMKDDRNTGLVVLCDYENMSAALSVPCLMQTNAFVTMFIKILKLRPQKIYFINSNSLTKSLTNLIIKLLPRKISERVIIWDKSAKDLTQVLPKEVLPSDYNGSLKSMAELTDDFVNYVCEFREWFQNEEDIKADLSKKLHDREVESDVALHGTEGSFRKLCVD